MKNKKVAVCLGITLFALAAGCGKSGGEPSVPAEAENTERFEDFKGAIDGDGMDSSESPERTSGTDFSEHPSGDGGMPEETDSLSDPVQGQQKTEELTGNVSSIGEDSIVISQSFEEEGGVLVAPADGSPDQVLITVRVSDQTQYEMKTVKNSGVNGDADVEKKSGSFSDLEQDSSVDLTGYYEGEEFVAEKIVIYRFV